jgi:hypothetical protein
MSDAHDSALLADRLGGLIRRESRCDRLVDVQRDEVTGRGPYLLADDDAQTSGCGVACAQGAFEPVVISYREIRQPARRGRTNDLFRLG